MVLLRLTTTATGVTASAAPASSPEARPKLRPTTCVSTPSDAAPARA